jgi:cleavage and polyadenylation specificity factor subunit 1
MCGIQLSWMTAHHPAANRLVEHFHRTLKAAIMCHADQQWSEALPLVLLRICTSFKEDLQASVTDLVYDEPLRIHGELLTLSANPVDPALLITDLRQHMARLRPVPAVRHAPPVTFMHKVLEKCTHIFLHQDAMPRALEPHTVAPTRSCHGEIRRCNYSYAGGLSLCQPTGSSQPTSSTRLTVGTTRTHQP